MRAAPHLVRRGVPAQRDTRVDRGHYLECVFGYLYGCQNVPRADGHSTIPTRRPPRWRSYHL
jgi:hypothetical protein